MDYLELDESAMQALGQLCGSFDLHHIPSKPPISNSTIPNTRSPRRVENKYLLRLEDPFSTPRDIANALGLSSLPPLRNASAEDHEAKFCQLPQSDINAFDSWTTKYYPSKEIIKFPIGLAHKDPGKLPFLGRDATLPHHRPQSPVNPTDQSMLEYPVNYFFYGTLSDPARLARLLDIPASELAPLQPAILLDGRTRILGGKYKALVDDPGARLDGFSYIIVSADQEDSLRRYETNNYEVVAANLIIDGKEIIGRTFRFAGSDDDLAE